TKDNDFTWKDFQARNNNELVAIFGNFINRVVVLTHKYYDGVVPEPADFSEVDTQTMEALRQFPASISSSIERYRFREAGQELMNLARLGNKYLADEEPWKVIKQDEKRVGTIMYVALQIAAALAVLSEPFLPFTSEKLKKMLNLSTMPAARLRTGLVKLEWSDIPRDKPLLKAGYSIEKAELLFRKVEDEEIQTQLDKLEATKKSNASTEPVLSGAKRLGTTNSKAEVSDVSSGNTETSGPGSANSSNNSIERGQPASPNTKNIMPQKDTINFDDFIKIDMRVGTILEAEKMPKTDKLMVLKVDTGLDIRTIVSGIAQSFSAEEIIGKQVTVLVNLAPRKLRGTESEGMILMTENAEGKLVFVNPDTSSATDASNNGVENGSGIS
ncbi:MAG: methionine--tRNA ligase subunit beta, partial [Pricia sp.]